MDVAIRYENLVDELEAVRLRLNLPEPLTLPRAKSSQRDDHRPYAEVLSVADRARIDAVCKKEIEYLGYRY